jgi:hypothetical protein
MISHISRILAYFRPCFSRKAAFNWFVVVVFGFIVRLDHCGVSSFVRWLGIRPELYTALVSHFRAKSWSLPVIMRQWWQIVLEHCPLTRIDGRLMIAADGIKICKEAEKMPGVKRLHQESDNSGKAPYIYGHHWGVIGILSGWVKKTVLHSPLCRDP